MTPAPRPRPPAPLPVCTGAEHGTPNAVCRHAGCAAAAGPDGLCGGHRAAQMILRDRAMRSPRQRPPAVEGAGGPYDALAGALAAHDAPWRKAAACRGRAAVMFPTHTGPGHRVDYRPALALCATCPVAAPCRAAGADEPDGVWGGTTPAMRRHLDREGRGPL